ncbi:MAG TPA: hypothetical protein P5279_17760, partial [Anaerohalosphaeraceae bacterium]|nr:hypothetical protein [Anaerohalosphaeraceae bacterium]HRT52339.1 hypothetical protein [Anaerohalosphaeraceae bacterium]HRT88341.1 hypothetical protein [Anaerohalosphaeraceae bacterium]
GRSSHIFFSTSNYGWDNFRQTSLIVNGSFDDTDVHNGWTRNEYFDENTAIVRFQIRLRNLGQVLQAAA